MVKKTNIINFQDFKEKALSDREKTKKTLTDPDLYDKQLIENEIARLRSEFGLNKKEKK